LSIRCWLIAYARAATWHVGTSGSDDFTEIQFAVDAAADGDTILIGPGQYDTFHPFTAPAWTEEVIVGINNDNLVFIGSGMDETIVGTTDPYYPDYEQPKGFCNVDGYSAVIKNMTLQHVATNVYWWHGKLEVSNCRIKCDGGAYSGLTLWTDEAVIKDCEFFFSRSPFGIILYTPAQNSLIQDCVFTGRATAIAAAWSPNARVISCVFNNVGVGVQFDFG